MQKYELRFLESGVVCSYLINDEKELIKKINGLLENNIKIVKIIER